MEPDGGIRIVFKMYPFGSFDEVHRDYHRNNVYEVPFSSLRFWRQEQTGLKLAFLNGRIEHHSWDNIRMFTVQSNSEEYITWRQQVATLLKEEPAFVASVRQEYERQDSQGGYLVFTPETGHRPVQRTTGARLVEWLDKIREMVGADHA